MPKLQKPRLGRGLSSLISVSDLPVEREIATNAEQIESHAPSKVEGGTPSSLEISLDQITPNPHQPRRQFSESALADLAASIRTNGLVQPIIVRRLDTGGYQLIAGERRWRAAKLANLPTIPAIVRSADSFTQAQLALVENIHREDLNPMDRASAYRALIDQLGLTQVELANRIGEDRSSVANFLRLLDLAEPVRQLIRDGQLSLGHAKVIAGVTDILEQQRLANLAATQGLSVRNLERLVQSPAAPPPASRTRSEPSAHVQDLEKSFARHLGMRVQIRPSAAKGKGRVVIHYASLDQFDTLLSRLGIPTEAE
jgi:ParB family transcriptional regulator, chromosome partitioning protein